MTEYIVRMPPNMPYEIKAELNAWYVESEPIVRCRDCKYMTRDMRINYCIRPAEFHEFAVNPDGFCSWGEPRWLTCKCGEEIEQTGGEFVVCPSCGRKL